MANWKQFRDYEKTTSKRLKLPDGSRIVVLSDLQVPLQDDRLLNTIINDFMPWFNPVGAEYHVFLNGDVLDNYSISHFIAEATPNFSLGDEIAMTREVLGRFGKEPLTGRHFVYGNHEKRWARYVRENAPKMAEFLPGLHQVLKLEEFGFDWVPYKKSYIVNGFVITHGDITAQSAALTSVVRYGKSGTSGHVNRPQSYTHKKFTDNEPDTWYCTGMLCRPDVADIITDFEGQPWQQCFGIGEVSNGVVHYELVRVHHGAFRAAGKMFKVGG